MINGPIKINVLTTTGYHKVEWSIPKIVLKETNTKKNKLNTACMLINTNDIINPCIGVNSTQYNVLLIACQF